MGTETWLASRFEEHRTHLRSVAWRMLGSRIDAEDAVQEAWLRLSRSDAGEVANLRGWLTTVTARVCLDMLRSRRSRAEVPMETPQAEPAVDGDDRGHPERETQLADSVGLALLVVLDTLSPAERVAFVLHDLFDMPFEEIAPIVGRTPAAARQLASRGRRRVQGARAAPDPARQRVMVEAFLAASRGGDFEALLALLDPSVVLRADAAGVAIGAQAEVRGAPEVARTFAGRAMGARPALVDGRPALVWAPGGRLRVAFLFTLAGDRVGAIDLVADAGRLGGFDVVMLDAPDAPPP